MLKNYVIVVLRNFFKSKTHSIINVSGLAIGIACCVLILLYVQHELTFDGFHRNAGRIYRLVEIQTFSGRSPEYVGLTMGPMGQAMVDDYPEVINYTRFLEWRRILARYEEKQMYVEDVFYADPAVFAMFDFELLAGDPAAALKEPNSIVITEETAQRFFGNKNPLGKILSEGDADYKVTGILKNLPKNSHLQFDMLISLNVGQDDPAWSWLCEWGANSLATYLMLDKDADYKALEKKFPDYLKRYLPRVADNYVFYLQPLRDIHLHSTQINYDYSRSKSDINTVYIFSAVAFFILLLACINFMNLATARSMGRAKEVGLRKVVGANRGQLIRQFMAESIFVAVIALFFAILLVELLLPSFNSLTQRELSLNLLQNLVIALGVLGMTLFVGLISGSYPAIFLAAFQPVTVLKGGFQAGTKGAFLRKALVVSQFAISIMLIIGTALAVRQLNYMRTKNMGFNQDHVITIGMNLSVQKRFELFKSEFLQNPNVTGVTATNRRLGTFLSETGIRYDGAKPEENWIVPYMMVDYEFIPFYELEMVEGRNFSRQVASDTAGAGAYIINEAMMRKLGWQSAVGKRFALVGGSEELGTIIGVLKDFHFYSLHHLIEPLVLYVRPRQLWSMSVRVRPENMASTLEFLKDKWQALEPGTPFEYSFLDETIARRYLAEERTGKVFGIFAILAVFIAALGLFGLASFTAEKRTKEIGIRKILGASVAGLVGLLSKDFVKLVLIANLIAWPIAYFAMNRWLQDFAYRVDIGWWIFALAGGVAFLIALLTVSAQAIKAALANPVESLRYE